MNTFAPADQFNQLVKSNLPFIKYLIVVLVGEANVGKTALVHRFIRNQAPPKDLSSTIGVEFSKRLLDLPAINMKAQIHIWDTAGQERFKSLTTQQLFFSFIMIVDSHYKGAQGALLVFDVMNAQSFQSTQHWLQELNEHTQPTCIIALICNKCDLIDGQQPAIPLKDVKKFAQMNGLVYYETSSYWERDRVERERERGGISSLVTNMVQDIVVQSMQEEQVSFGDNSMAASASQKKLRPQDVSKNAADDQKHDGKVTIKDKKLLGGKERTEIRVSGIRLDKEQLFEIENKEESSCNC